MEWLKDKKNRWVVSIFAAMAAAVLVAGGVRESGVCRTTAWWGTMYPEFCFAKGDEDSPRKIAFRLAEDLDW